MNNVLLKYENMTMNKIYSKICLLVYVILYHSVCLLYYKIGFQYPHHLEIKLNEILSFQHDHFWISYYWETSF